MGWRSEHLDRGTELNSIRPIAATDREQLSDILTRSWGSTTVDTRGRLVDVLGLPGFVAESDEEWLGYASYAMRGPAVEVAVLEALSPDQGVGSALLATCVGAAIEANANRLWLITTNDNVDALRFYQRRGFVLVAVHRDAVTHSRATHKPEIPLVGFHGIPLRDEIELELPHAIWPDFIERYSWPS